MAEIMLNPQNLNPMSKNLCISSEQDLSPASSAFRNMMRFLRVFAANFSAVPELEKTGLDRNKPDYSEIKRKIIFAAHEPDFQLFSLVLICTHLFSDKKKILFSKMRSMANESWYDEHSACEFTAGKSDCTFL
jgi:hypothetical protein